jgi:hypothetical protein
LSTINGKELIAVAVKPICTSKNVFRLNYIFGAFSPYYEHDSSVMELSYCNGDNFTQVFHLNLVFNICFAVQLFLMNYQKKMPLVYEVIILDDVCFHKGKISNFGQNIAIFFPPFSPELNPAELLQL